MWTYQQSTGWMSRNGIAGLRLANGYAGAGDGKNNPAMQDVAKVGPLPRGKYTIVGPPYHDEKTGADTMKLVPDPANEMFGRDAFRIHGDSIQHPGEASEGCIVLPRFARLRIWESGDLDLEVVE